MGDGGREELMNSGWNSCINHDILSNHICNDYDSNHGIDSPLITWLPILMDQEPHMVEDNLVE